MAKRPVSEYTDLGSIYNGTIEVPQQMVPGSYKRIKSTTTGILRFRVLIDGQFGHLCLSVEGREAIITNEMALWDDGDTFGQYVYPMVPKDGNQFQSNGWMVDVGDQRFGAESLPSAKWLYFSVLPLSYDPELTLDVVVSDWLDSDGEVRTHVRPSTRSLASHDHIAAAPSDVYIPARTGISGINPLNQNATGYFTFTGEEHYGFSIGSASFDEDKLWEASWDQGGTPIPVDVVVAEAKYKASKTWQPPHLFTTGRSSAYQDYERDPDGQIAENPVRLQRYSGNYNGGAGMNTVIQTGGFDPMPGNRIGYTTRFNGTWTGPVWGFHMDVFDGLPEWIGTSVANEVYPGFSNEYPSCGYRQINRGFPYDRAYGLHELESSPPYVPETPEEQWNIFQSLEQTVAIDTNSEVSTYEYTGSDHLVSYWRTVTPGQDAFNEFNEPDGAWIKSTIELSVLIPDGPTEEGDADRIYIRTEPIWSPGSAPPIPTDASFFSFSRSYAYYLGKYGLLLTWQWEPATYELVPPVWDELPEIETPTPSITGVERSDRRRFMRGAK